MERARVEVTNHSSITQIYIIRTSPCTSTNVNYTPTCLAAFCAGGAQRAARAERRGARVRRSEYNRVHEHDIPHRARTTAASKSLTKPVLGALGPPKYREPSYGRFVQTCPRPQPLWYRTRVPQKPHWPAHRHGARCRPAVSSRRSVNGLWRPSRPSTRGHLCDSSGQRRCYSFIAHTPKHTAGICPAVSPRLPSMPRISARRQQAGSTGSLEVVQPSRLTRSSCARDRPEVL